MRGGRPGEVERPETARRDLAAHHLDHVRISPLILPSNDGNQGRQIDVSVGKWGDRSRDGCRIDRRQVALHVHDHVVPPLRVELFHSLEDAVGAGRMVSPGHDRLPAGARHGLSDLGRIGRDRHRPDPRFHRPAPHVDDHGLASDVGQRLVGQARCGHTGRDEDEGVGHDAIF
jgi:hypothetical protein